MLTSKRQDIIRQVEKDLNSPIGILADLQGPKLRVGTFENEFEDLEAGASFRLDLNDEPGSKGAFNFRHPEIFAALKTRAHLLINDGKIRLEVESCGADFAQCRVEIGNFRITVRECARCRPPPRRPLR